MQILEIHARTRHDGKLLLELPEPLRDQALDMVIIVQPCAQQRAPQENTGAVTAETRWNAISPLLGRLKWRGDACAAQRRLRNEW